MKSYAQQQNWRNQRVTAAIEVVKAYLDAHWKNKVITDDVSACYLDIERDGIHIIFVNFSSPSLVRNESSKFIYDMLGAMVNSPDGDNLGLTLGPVHANQRGTVYRQEAFINNQLADANLNIDRMWGVSFEARLDQRDERPLFYNGRVCQRMGKPLASSVWAKSELFSKSSQLGPAPALKTADMTTIEEVWETALPPSTNVYETVSQAEKHQQIGVAAMQVVLRGVLAGVALPAGDLHFTDLFPHTGDGIKASLLQQADLTMTLKVTSYSQSEADQLWLDREIQDWAVQQFMSGVLKIKGAQPLAAEMPREMLEGELAKPELKVLVWAGNKKDVPTLPKVYIDKYAEHSDEEIKTKFVALQTQFKRMQAKHMTDDLGEGPPTKKRKLFYEMAKLVPKDDANAGTPTKRAKTEIAPQAAGALADVMPATVGLSTLPALVMTSSLPMGKKTMMEVQVRDADAMKTYLVNAGPPDGESLAASPGMTICGWWKGTWFHNQMGEPLTPSDVPFVLEDSHTMVMIGSRLVSLGVLLAERKDKSPGASAKVLYHEATDEPRDGDPSYQTYKTMHQMIWRPNTGAPVSQGELYIYIYRYKIYIYIYNI